MLCVQIRYLTRSDNGTLRQPVLRALPRRLTVDAATADLYEIEG